jgi:hypothetical protein
MSAELLISSRTLYGLMTAMAEERTFEVRLQKPAILPSSTQVAPKNCSFVDS